VPASEEITVNLNTPTIEPGRIIAADLDAARQHSTGTVVHLHRTVVMPSGLGYQGRHETRRFGQQAEFVDTVPTDYGALDDSAAVEGGKQRNPAPAMESMWSHRRTAAAVRGGVALVAVLAVAAYVARALWPMAGA
jgi:hypothetical protein